MSRRWTCGRCAVIVSYGPEADVPTRPDGWVRDNGAWRCLRCRREDAMDEASSASTAEGRADRRRALLAFEIRRDPAAYLASHGIAGDWLPGGDELTPTMKLKGRSHGALEGAGRVAALPAGKGPRT